MDNIPNKFYYKRSYIHYQDIWRVYREGILICVCYTENDAKIITEALNKTL